MARRLSAKERAEIERQRLEYRDERITSDCGFLYLDVWGVVLCLPSLGGSFFNCVREPSEYFLEHARRRRREMLEQGGVSDDEALEKLDSLEPKMLMTFKCADGIKVYGFQSTGERFDLFDLWGYVVVYRRGNNIYFVRYSEGDTAYNEHAEVKPLSSSVKRALHRSMKQSPLV